MSAKWLVGDHPKAPMPSRFVVAVDDVINLEIQLGKYERQLAHARQRLNEARDHMHEMMPREIDNAKVGYRLPDVFAWRRRS